MSFLNPLLALGTIAALIPLLVHLFDRRRPRQVPFGAIAFVLRSQKRTAARLRLRRLLLYALRTLLLLCLPLALARPLFSRDGDAATAQHRLASTVIVLDTSMSMRFSKGTSLFQRALEEARAAVRDLAPEESVSVLRCGTPGARAATPTFDKARWLEHIDDSKPGLLRADLNRCLDDAARALADTTLAGKRIVVISDFTAADFALEGVLPTVNVPNQAPVRPMFVLRDVARDMTLPNRAITDVRATAATQAGPRAFAFVATVQNFSETPLRDTELRLTEGSRVLEKAFVDVPAFGMVQKTITHRFDKPGPTTVTLSLEPDALPDDDTFELSFTVPNELRALVVNGDPSPQRLRDEAFFVESALQTSSSPVRAVVRDAASGWREDFSAYQLVMLLNTEAPTAAAAASLQTFVEKGGGLFISAGDRVDVEAWNARLGALLPRQIRVVKNHQAGNRSASPEQLLDGHPLLAPFAGEAKSGLITSRVFKTVLLEVAGARKSEVLISLDDGSPLLVASDVGLGRVLFLATSVDRDWSDLALRPAFLPLIQRAVLFLAHALEEREANRATVGQTAPVARGVAELRDPHDAALVLERLPDGSIVTPVLAEPGEYRAYDAAHALLPTAGLTVKLDPQESNLTRVDNDALAKYFGDETVATPTLATAAASIPPWSWLLLAVLLAFFFEGLLLAK